MTAKHVNLQFSDTLQSKCSVLHSCGVALTTVVNKIKQIARNYSTEAQMSKLKLMHCEGGEGQRIY